MCINPIEFKIESRNFNKVRIGLFPCGCCIECQKRRQNDWKLRIIKEASYYSHFYFFTLTYRNNVLPCSVFYVDDTQPLYSGTFLDCTGFCSSHDLTYCSPRDIDRMGFVDCYVSSTTCKKHIQDLFKRFRTSYERKNGVLADFKYFICSEYGPNPNGTKRPHYHGLIMSDIPYNDFLPLFNEWQRDFGRMEFKEVGIKRDEKSKVANYISKYCCKGSFDSRLQDIKDGRCDKAFYLMSKNIGLRWLEDNKVQWTAFCPESLKMQGLWDIDHVERYFSRREGKPARLLAEVERLIDHLTVYDGDNFKYKIPRYFFERLFYERRVNTRCVTTDKPKLRSVPFCDSPIQERHFCKASNFVITYETREVKDVRYCGETFIAAAISYCLRERASARSRESMDVWLQSHPDISYESALRLYTIREQDAIKARGQVASQSLGSFYTLNMWNHREFDD